MELLGQNKIDHHQRQVVILSQDSFYKVLTPEQKAKALKGQFNFDHPGMWPFPQLYPKGIKVKNQLPAPLIRLFAMLALAHPAFGAMLEFLSLTILNPCTQRVLFSSSCS